MVRQRAGQECVWSSCTLLHQTGIAVALHIPPVVLPAFLHTPALNILPWKNPLRRHRPLPLQKYPAETTFAPPHACWLFCLLALPPFTYCSDATRLLSFLSLGSFSSLSVPAFSSLTFLPTFQPSHLQGSQSLLQPAQLTTQTGLIGALAAVADERSGHLKNGAEEEPGPCSCQ